MRISPSGFCTVRQEMEPPWDVIIAIDEPSFKRLLLYKFADTRRGPKLSRDEGYKEGQESTLEYI